MTDRSEQTVGRPLMKAVRQEVFGGPEVLQLVEVPRPQPGISEVLVRVHAAGVNPTDWKHRAARRFLGNPPYTLGWDVSGTVEEMGLGVTIHKPGDEVYGMLRYPHGAGSHAEYVIAPARALVPKPAGLNHVQAGAIPLAALTAWQSLVDTAGLGPGDRVLIHAAAGGVGHLAVQVAKARGAYVIGTASAGKHGFVQGLGADEMVDYRHTDFTEVVKDVDVVLDTIGGDYQLRSLECLRQGGTLVSLLPKPAEGLYEKARQLGVRVELILAEADRAGMQAVSELVETDKLKVTIADTFPLAEAARAHEAGETGRTTGKLVLTVAAWGK
ncbi:NADP-dependent oxidoreductase [Nesterenkonia alkaliphila]|uniref:Zinc-binding dehydrogenase n=1 Tax=Nesterenkonia alkaliphila TaxID=1463631 RepID=A0A7K1UFU3_9MICC|nr:NADP-dependent oxidoreductase [Nesterenkonia alkaliphila]MVT24951.1 zinc-binding dehydrogenase [Nesterenkonia alkaliphila]GFZ86903.1 NADPH:quinone reductase [Nesterenkonia alkaliphila]